MSDLQVSFSITSGFEQLVPNQPATVTMEVLNVSAASVTLGSVVPVLSPIDGGANIGIPTTVASSTLAAGAARYYTWKLVFFAPQSANDVPSPCTYTVGAAIYDSTGILYSAPTQTVTMALGTATAPTPAGYFLFSSALNSSNLMLW